MANYLAIHDPDQDRCSHYLKLVKQTIAPVDGLVLQQISIGPIQVLLATHENTPVALHKGDSACILLGMPYTDQSARLDASTLDELWCDASIRRRTVMNGYFTGMRICPDGEFVAGVDQLGFFPMYYWQGPGVFLLSSSIDLFLLHPLFETQVDHGFMVALLLAGNSVGGETMLSGVRRLKAGHLLVWSPGNSPREEENAPLPVSDESFSLPFSVQVDLLHETIAQVMRAQTDGSECGLFLSGGLDSRMLAGYLHQMGKRPRTLTLGVDSDIEMHCARRVAKSLGLEHRTLDVSAEQFVRCAGLQCRWESLANGFNFIMNWGVHPGLNGSGAVVMGHAFDAVVGTNYIGWAYSPASKTMAFDTYFERVNRWGIGADALRKGLRPELAGLVDQTVQQFRKKYQGYSEHEFQRAWCFNLRHRQRFHVGGAAWAYSFGAWPILPALDHRLLALAGSMPASTIAERRAQIEILCRKFPRLAALPLDRNDGSTTPLRPGLSDHILERARRRLGLLRGTQKRLDPERLYYYRIFNFNGPGWRSVRRAAEPARERLQTFFRPGFLDEILPGPEEELKMRDGIVDASGVKTLLGLMMWSERTMSGR
jgi:asparagine synthase (glutamine-hydrolysing)